MRSEKGESSRRWLQMAHSDGILLQNPFTQKFCLGSAAVNRRVKARAACAKTAAYNVMKYG